MTPQKAIRNILLTTFVFLSLELSGSLGIFNRDFSNGLYLLDIPISVVIEDDTGHLKELMEDAMNDWEDALEFDIWQIDEMAKEDKPSIIVRWSNDFSEESSEFIHTLGRIERIYLDGEVAKMEMILNKKNLLFLRNDEDILKLVLLHELGHSIGLSHIQNEKSIMSRIIDLETRSLQQIDIIIGKRAVDIIQAK